MALAALDLRPDFPGGQLVAVALAEPWDRNRRAPRRSKSARRSTKRAPLNRRGQRLFALVKAIGEPLLRGPSDSQSLRHRLERASIDPALNRAVSALSASVDLGSLLSMSLEPVAADLTPKLGEAAALSLVRGMRYEIAALAASMNLLAQMPRDAEAALRASRRGGVRAAHVVTEYLNRLLYDPSVPLTVSETFAAVGRGNAAILGIAFALMSGRRLSHGLATELGQVYVDGMHRYARLLASIPSTGVSDEIVPPAERYDLSALERTHTDFWHRIAAGEHSFGTPDDDG